MSLDIENEHVSHIVSSASRNDQPIHIISNRPKFRRSCQASIVIESADGFVVEITIHVLSTCLSYALPRQVQRKYCLSCVNGISLLFVCLCNQIKVVRHSTDHDVSQTRPIQWTVVSGEEKVIYRPWYIELSSIPCQRLEVLFNKFRSFIVVVCLFLCLFLFPQP